MNQQFYINSEEERNYVSWIISLLDLSSEYTVTISEGKSISQQSLYWIWVTAIEDETGTGRKDVHNHLKDLFNDGDSTSDLDMFNFQKYMTKVNAWAASELGIKLPSPGDEGFQDFFDKYSRYKKK